AARRAVFSMHIVQHAAGGELAPAAQVPQLDKAGQVQPVQACVLVRKAQVDEVVGGGQVGIAAGRHAAHGATAALGVDVVVDVSEVRRGLDAPLLAAGVMPVGGGAQGVGHFGFQVHIADVAVAVAGQVDHAH